VPAESRATARRKTGSATISVESPVLADRRALPEVRGNSHAAKYSAGDEESVAQDWSLR
jgi:hypothetical protein